MAKLRILQKIKCEGIGDVIEAHHPQEPPAVGPQLLLQTSDRGQCKEVGPQHGYPKNDKHFERWGGAYVSEPRDKSEMNEKR